MARRAAGYATEINREIAETPAEYLPVLLQIIRLYRQSISLKPANESFRQGMKEAVAGESYPVADLWDDIDAE